MTIRRAGRLSALLAVLLASAGCSRKPADVTTVSQVVLEPVPGSPVHAVHISQTAFDALQVRTQPIRAASGGLVIPLEAVVYAPDGTPWTYVALAPRSYVRRAIVIDHIAGAEAFLRSGPAAGTAVVAVGAPELLGSEYAVGEE